MAEELGEVEEDVEPIELLPRLEQLEEEQDRASVVQNLIVQVGHQYVVNGDIVRLLISLMEIQMLASVALPQTALSGPLHALNGVIARKEETAHLQNPQMEQEEEVQVRRIKVQMEQEWEEKVNVVQHLIVQVGLQSAANGASVRLQISQMEIQMLGSASHPQTAQTGPLHALNGVFVKKIQMEGLLKVQAGKNHQHQQEELVQAENRERLALEEDQAVRGEERILVVEETQMEDQK